MWKPNQRSTPGAEGQQDVLAKALLKATQSFLEQQGIEREATLDTPLAEPGLGLDSIQRMDLLGEIEKRCTVTVPEALWSDTPVSTLRQLLKHLAG